MNHRGFFCILFFLSLLSSLWGQKSALKKQLKQFDFSAVILPDSLQPDLNSTQKIARPKILAFVGNNYMRFEIRIAEAFKDSANPTRYRMWGRTRHMGWARTFIGDLYVLDVNLEKKAQKGLRKGWIKFKVLMREDSLSQGAAHYEGTLTCHFILTQNNQILYDATLLGKPEFKNNQFVGNRIPFDNRKAAEVCNWGDFRIPDCGDLDVGKDQFRPNEKYLNQNWRMYQLILTGNPSWEATKQAILEENSLF